MLAFGEKQDGECAADYERAYCAGISDARREQVPAFRKTAAGMA